MLCISVIGASTLPGIQYQLSPPRQHNEPFWDHSGCPVGTEVTAMVAKNTPRLFKKYNVRIKWGDGREGPAFLKVADYKHGPDVPFDSWFFCTRAGHSCGRVLNTRTQQCNVTLLYVRKYWLEIRIFIDSPSTTRLILLIAIFV